MDFKHFLLEMPITTFQKLGKWGEKDKKRGYSAQDIGILTSEKGVEKIKTKWENTPQDFDLYFLRSPEGYKVREVGQVSEEYLKNTLKIDIPINPSNITVIFTQNLGTEKIPMTAWAIGHRFGHAVRRLPSYQHYIKETINDFKYLLKQFFRFEGQTYTAYGLNDFKQISKTENMMKKLAHAIGTMKSAREGKLVNYFEFFHELFAQYLLTGEVKFNTPDKILDSYTWGRPQFRHISKDDYFALESSLESLKYEIENNIEVVLADCVGKIFVM